MPPWRCIRRYGPWTEPEHLVPRLDAAFYFREPDRRMLRH